MAVFGMESSCVGPPDGVRHCGTVCLDRSAAEQNAFHGMRSGDFVFIKEYTPEAGLDVTALGVVLPDDPVEEGRCLPVDWVWTGAQHIRELDDSDPARSEPFYEEYNLTVQREVLDLLPASLRVTLP